MTQFYTLRTAVGLQKYAAAEISGNPVQLATIHIGTGGGEGFYNSYDSAALVARTELVDERWSAPISFMAVDPDNPSRIIVEGVIPQDEGGYSIREVGIKDAEDDLIAIGRFPPTYKMSLADGSAQEILIRVLVEWANASLVTLVVDPSQALATHRFIYDYAPRVRRPLNIAPVGGIEALFTPTLEGGPYYPLHGIPQLQRHFYVYDNADGAGNPLYTGVAIAPDTITPALSHTVETNLPQQSTFWWCYQDETVLDDISDKSPLTSFTTPAIFVEAPTITSPADEAVDVPEMPVIETSAFSVAGGTDTHIATQIRIRLASNGTVIHDSGDITANMTAYAIPEGVLQDGETGYLVEARHQGETYGWSEWSAQTGFTTEVEFFDPTNIGAPYGGGYIAGTIVSDYDGLTYLLILSPGDGDSGSSTRNWRTTSTIVNNTGGVPPNTAADGKANYDAIIAAAAGDLTLFPAVKWCEDNCNAGSGLNGYTDWYLPSRDELELCYRHFKPKNADNENTLRDASTWYGAAAVYGTNQNSDPPGSGYSDDDPPQTSLVPFQEGQAEAFATGFYWSSTEDNGPDAWIQNFWHGRQLRSGFTALQRVRAVRRILLS
ncbi:MAG: phage tail protein [Porticoccaceae bacterium]